jgi:flagellar biosynthetic protein FliR
MNAQLIIISTFLLLCRIGACLMIAPGVGNLQIPTQIRLFVVVAITLTLAPMLLARAEPIAASADPITIARFIVQELAVDGLIGVLARLFFSALDTMAFAAATLLGMANPFGAELDQVQPLPPLSTLVTLGATTMIFVTDAHWQLLIGLLDSYHAIPLGAAFDARRGLAEIGAVLGQSLGIAARVASPFFLYSVIANFAMALVNRVTPQIGIFFIAPPFVVGGGVMLLYLTIRGQVAEFIAAFSAWLGSG